MTRILKSPLEKLETKIASILLENPALNRSGNRITFENQLILSFSNNQINFWKKRYNKSSEVKLSNNDYLVKIHLNQETINLISRNSVNSPTFINYLRKIFKAATDVDFNRIEIGSDSDNISNRTLRLTYRTYRILEQINKEEKTSEAVRFKSRAATILNSNFGIILSSGTVPIDWSVRLQEIILSGQLTQQDIQRLTSQLQPGNNAQVVIKHQVDKQVEWLLQKLEDILEEDDLNKTKAKQLGSSIFSYTQAEIKGAEHLMEKILTDYGQHTLFGVPALINTNKYVLQERFPRAQFDLLLVTSLGDIEVVELKKPDTILLDFDSQRNKFYASTELSKAIAQTERYISSVIKDNDEELKIDNKTIRAFINDELGGLIHVETIRPTGLIIIGSSKTLCVAYDQLDVGLKTKFTRAKYNSNCERAYRELRDSHKNIKIVTYSDLVEGARLRLQLDSNS